LPVSPTDLSLDLVWFAASGRSSAATRSHGIRMGIGSCGVTSSSPRLMAMVSSYASAASLGLLGFGNVGRGIGDLVSLGLRLVEILRLFSDFGDWYFLSSHKT
jgi:hypothetical protein